ncbi:hypothetical protein BJY59DRAFT_700877 [Rhodotorula toruloides]
MTPPRLPTASSNSRPGPKRPPVNAAPAEIVAPISLRRVRPGEQAVQAGNGSNGTSAARNAPVASASGGKGGVKRGQVQPIGQKDARDLPARPEVPRQPVASTSDGTSRSRHSLAERILPRDPEESREQDGRGQAGGRDDARGETNGRGRGRGRGGGGAVRGGQGGGRGGGHSHGRENGRAAAHGGNPRPRTKDPRLLRLGELASWVLVDNKAVPLYKTESEGPMKLTCYLEAVEGAEFAVGFRDERERGEDDAADFLCEVIVDGVVCGCVRSRSAPRELLRARFARSVRITRSLMFSAPRFCPQRRPPDHPRMEEIDNVELARRRQEAVVHLARAKRECGAFSSSRLSVTLSLVERALMEAIEHVITDFPPTLRLLPSRAHFRPRLCLAPNRIPASLSRLDPATDLPRTGRRGSG